MPKFNVGDEVRVTRIVGSPHYYGRYTRDMHELVGRVFTIKRWPDSDGDYYLSCEYFVHGDDLELATHKSPYMPETFRTMVDTDDTRTAVFDLLEIPEFRKFMCESWSVKVCDFDSLGDCIKKAIDAAMLKDMRQEFYNFICEHMGWEDPKLAQKRQRLAELKQQIAELEKEIEQA